jgi:DNA-binding CsgD family transcriptional regulator
MFEQGNGVDLDRLNDAERQVLQLLAEGHTAKSVANVLGSTPAAVNERLREARRKTGAGSSRELARLLKSQENRDDELGVGKGAALAAAQPLSDAGPWRPHKGVVAMIALFVIATAGAATLMGQDNPQQSQVDPLLAKPLMKMEDPVDLHGKVRSEARDEAWASRVEKAVHSRLLQLPLVGKNGNQLRVTCAATLCEIAGSIAGRASEPYDPKQPLNQAVSDLQAKPLRDDLSKLGLTHVSGLFTGGDNPDRAVFFQYYSRAG